MLVNFVLKKIASHCKFHQPAYTFHLVKLQNKSISFKLKFKDKIMQYDNDSFCFNFNDARNLVYKVRSDAYNAERYSVTAKIRAKTYAKRAQDVRQGEREEERKRGREKEKKRKEM